MNLKNLKSFNSLFFMVFLRFLFYFCLSVHLCTICMQCQKEARKGCQLQRLMVLSGHADAENQILEMATVLLTADSSFQPHNWVLN